MARWTKTGARGRKLDAGEEWLWRETMRDVKPIRPLSVIETVAPTVPQPATKSAPKPAPPKPVPPKASQQTLGTGIDGATARRMASGRLAPEATLDLHGMTQDHAHTALERFLAHSVALSRRCVLVITGKGGKKPEGDNDPEAPWMKRRPGVLRTLVPLWLEHSPHRTAIAALRQAHIRHGGAGALYIYLRNK
jgi:DNA-nicking Smr family endonuclease